MAFAPGDKVWAHTATDEAFAECVVERCEPHKGMVVVRFGRGVSFNLGRRDSVTGQTPEKEKGVAEVALNDVHKTNDAKQDGVPDNTYLRELNEAREKSIRARAALRLPPLPAPPHGLAVRAPSAN